MLGFAQELAELVYYKSAYYKMKEERDYLKREYDEMLSGSIKHGEVMIGNLLNVMLECDIKKKV